MSTTLEHDGCPCLLVALVAEVADALRPRLPEDEGGGSGGPDAAKVKRVDHLGVVDAVTSLVALAL